MISQKARKITPFLVMDVMERALELEKAGADIVHLELGEPDFETPEVIKEAGIRALREGKTHYTHSMGLLELREAISQNTKERYGVTVSPEQILVTSGSSPCMQMTFAALLESGDEVILADPGYACYRNMIEFHGGVPVPVEIREEEGFELLPQAIERKVTSRTRAILINSPANPTGTLISCEHLRRIASLGVPILSDEIYHGLVYGEREHTILEFTDQAFVFNGFSKLYAMTGWRLGYVMIPKEFQRPLQKIQQNFLISASAFVQWAGVAALQSASADVQRMVETYNARRKILLQGLRGLGFTIPYEPLGAFYVFVNVKKFCSDSLRFAFEVLANAHVGVAPGIDFGPSGEGYVRFSYASAADRIHEGVERLGRFLKTISR
jgi:aspartate/methionine/tyrosine aminotransferase